MKAITPITAHDAKAHQIMLMHAVDAVLAGRQLAASRQAGGSVAESYWNRRVQEERHSIQMLRADTNMGIQRTFR